MLSLVSTWMGDRLGIPGAVDFLICFAQTVVVCSPLLFLTFARSHCFFSVLGAAVLAFYWVG